MQSLPSWLDGARALRVVARFLDSKGATLEAQARLKDGQGSEMLLNQFSMFSADEACAATEWCVPGGTVDRDEVLNIWEEFVESEPWTRAMPDRLPRRAYKSNRTSNKFFGGEPRPSGMWWVPAAQLIAVASKLSGVQAKTGPGYVTLDMGDYRMEAYADGLWSNMQGKLTRAECHAKDAGLSLLEIPGFLTSHPLVDAVMVHTPGPSTLWALNSALRAEAAGVIPKVHVGDLVYIERRKGPGRKVHVRNLYDVQGAVAALRSDLEMGVPISGLYSTAVPLAMSAREFKRVIGDRWTRPDNVLRRSTVERVCDYLDKREADIQLQ